MNRRIAGTVLVFEAIVILLAIPVAINVSGVAPGVALPIGLVLAARAVDRRHGVAAGWALQGLVLASGIIVPGMLLLGAMFAALWYGALRMVAAVGARQQEDPDMGEGV